MLVSPFVATLSIISLRGFAFIRLIYFRKPKQKRFVNLPQPPHLLRMIAFSLEEAAS